MDSFQYYVWKTKNFSNDRHFPAYKYKQYFLEFFSFSVAIFSSSSAVYFNIIEYNQKYSLQKAHKYATPANPRDLANKQSPLKLVRRSPDGARARKTSFAKIFASLGVSKYFHLRCSLNMCFQTVEKRKKRRNLFLKVCELAEMTWNKSTLKWTYKLLRRVTITLHARCNQCPDCQEFERGFSNTLAAYLLVSRVNESFSTTNRSKLWPTRDVAWKLP